MPRVVEGQAGAQEGRLVAPDGGAWAYRSSGNKVTGKSAGSFVGPVVK